MANPRILVVDSTGRGHALCDLLIRTDPAVEVFYGPGSAAIHNDRILPVSNISLSDVGTVIEFCRRTEVEFVFVSYIESLAAGFVDQLRAHGIPCVGPTRAAAELESDKRRAKHFCTNYGIPTAPFAYFDNLEAAKAYIRSRPYNVVVKANGLCPVGDGTTVCSTPDEAELAVDALVARAPNEFSAIVEQRLFGDEISIFALLDGTDYLLFPTARDFKRALDGDRGKNCDGMGSIAPHPLECPALRATIRATILDPLCRGLRAEGLDFTGFIYVGAMITARSLQVLEINARFGDSEAQAVLPSVHSNFTMLCRKVLARNLANAALATDGFVRCSVAATQGATDPANPKQPPGWPFGDFERGNKVTGLEHVDRDGANLFIAGLTLDRDGTPITAAGRVLHVVGRGLLPAEAIATAYEQMAHIQFSGKRCRADIGRACLSAWSSRRAWWRDVEWSRCIHRAAARVWGHRSSPLRGIFAHDMAPRTWLFDSALVAYFAGERQASDVLELLNVLWPAIPQRALGVAGLIVRVTKSRIANRRAVLDAEAALCDELRKLPRPEIPPLHIRSQAPVSQRAPPASVK